MDIEREHEGKREFVCVFVREREGERLRLKADVYNSYQGHLWMVDIFLVIYVDMERIQVPDKDLNVISTCCN